MHTPEEKTRDFLAALSDIEFQHITYFILREPKHYGDIRDKLSNYYRFQIQNGIAYFGFTPESGLPRKIRKQSWSKFGYFFPDGKIVGSVMER